MTSTEKAVGINDQATRDIQGDFASDLAEAVAYCWEAASEVSKAFRGPHIWDY